jgi:hypothetical protein
VKKILFVLAASLSINIAMAQDNNVDDADYIVVLPDAAQSCVLPAAPDAISPEATYDELIAAKKQVGEFQEALGTYRACMQAAEEGSDITPGNKQALVASYNYSVDMEERVAQRFNDAVRSYKERNPSE